MPFLDCLDCRMMGRSKTTICKTCGSKNTRVVHAWYFQQFSKSSMALRVWYRQWDILPAGIEAALANIKRSNSPMAKKGQCLMVITSSASLVEGVVTDYLEMEATTRGNDPAQREVAKQILANLDGIGWDKKKNRAARLGWDLAKLEEFEAVNTLFSMRDNMGHGRTYTIDKPEKLVGRGWRNAGQIHIPNEKYRRIHDRLVEMGISSSTSIDCSPWTELFLRLEVVTVLYDAAISFLRAFITEVRLSNGQTLEDEFDLAVSSAVETE